VFAKQKKAKLPAILLLPRPFKVDVTGLRVPRMRGGRAMGRQWKKEKQSDLAKPGFSLAYEHYLTVIFHTLCPGGVLLSGVRTSENHRLHTGHIYIRQYTINGRTVSSVPSACANLKRTTTSSPLVPDPESTMIASQCVCVLSVYFEGHRAEPLTELLQRAPKGRLTRTPHPQSSSQNPSLPWRPMLRLYCPDRHPARNVSRYWGPPRACHR
jgi:hypothetical protein